MKIELNNIGKLETASVEIKGITVIAGANNTGKSTVGKALFSVFNAFCYVDKQVNIERVSSIENLLDRMFFSDLRLRFGANHSRDIAESIVYDQKQFMEATDSDITKRIIDQYAQCGVAVNLPQDNDCAFDIANRIKEVLSISDQDFLKIILGRRLNSEFSGQICNIFSDKDSGSISLCIQGNRIDISIGSDGSLNIDNQHNISLGTEVVYIDDPFILDEINGLPFLGGSAFLPYHREHLMRKIYKSFREVNVFDEILANGKLDDIYEIISSVCVGDIVNNSRPSQVGYKIPSSDKILIASNLSTGLKTFAILKKLLNGGVIQDNGTIILDEPEIHLHPEWQLSLAKIIVLLHKNFKLHVLVNTHSPYFLRAIEVYSAKYCLSNACKYYLADASGHWSNITDVSDNITQIYKQLNRPFQLLENERWFV